MALDSMSNVTTGISISGLDNLKEEIRNTLEVLAKDKLTDLSAVNNSIRDTWSGEDCEIFIKNLEKMSGEICDALSECNKEIAIKLEELKKEWSVFQSNHSPEININI